MSEQDCPHPPFKLPPKPAVNLEWCPMCKLVGQWEALRRITNSEIGCRACGYRQDVPDGPRVLCLDDDQDLRLRFLADRRGRDWDFEGTEAAFQAELARDAAEHQLWGHAYEHNFGGCDDADRAGSEEIGVSVWRLRSAWEVAL